MNPNLYRTEFNMNTTATHPTPAKTVTPKNDLAQAVKLMDSLSQEAFQSIIAVARLALIALESPAGHRNMSALAFALENIAAKADDAMTSINFEAEKVGHDWHDDASQRRNRAAREAALHS